MCTIVLEHVVYARNIRFYSSLAVDSNVDVILCVGQKELASLWLQLFVCFVLC